MSDSNEQKRPNKDIEVFKDGKEGKTSVSLGTADILAVAALIVAVIIALGMVFGKIDGKIGAGLLVAVCGGAAIAKVVGAGKGGSK